MEFMGFALIDPDLFLCMSLSQNRNALLGDMHYGESHFWK